jgi:branched-chain amino acid transport system substrate-binding protein
MNTIISFVLALLVLISAGCKNKERERIAIGAILPLTGDAALAGVNTKEGIDLGVSLVNESSGIEGKQLVVVYEDTKADPKTGVLAVQKLIDQDKVQYIIDNSISSVTLAVAPIVEARRVVLVATGASAPSISDAGEYVFRIWNSDAAEGATMARYALDSLALGSVAVMYSQNDYGTGLSQAFLAELGTQRTVVSKLESFKPNALDYRAQIVKLLNTRPKALYLVGYSQDCIGIIRQSKQLGFAGIILGTTVMLDPSVLDAARASKFKVYFPTPIGADTASENYTKFRNRFESLYKKAPPALADVGFDAVLVLVEAVAKGGGISAAQIREGLFKIKKFEGASGEIEFDAKGDVHKPIQVRLHQ